MSFLVTEGDRYWTGAWNLEYDGAPNIGVKISIVIICFRWVCMSLEDSWALPSYAGQ